MSFSRISKITLAGAAFGILFFSALPVAAQVSRPCTPPGQTVANGQEITIGIPGENGTTTNCVRVDGQTLNDNPIVIFFRAVIQFFAIGVGILVAGGWTAGSIIYMTARGNTAQVEKAQEVLRNTSIGFLLFLGLFAIVNFLIPGGILT